MANLLVGGRQNLGTTSIHFLLKNYPDISDAKDAIMNCSNAINIK